MCSEGKAGDAHGVLSDLCSGVNQSKANRTKGQAPPIAHRLNRCLPSRAGPVPSANSAVWGSPTVNVIARHPPRRGWLGSCSLLSALTA